MSAPLVVVDLSAEHTLTVLMRTLTFITNGCYILVIPIEYKKKDYEHADIHNLIKLLQVSIMTLTVTFIEQI